MSGWRQAVERLRRAQIPVMLVSVDSIIGSTPREPGAKMLVTADRLYGTIGGGNLEFQACRIARDQLELGAAGGLQRFPLGAGLGQCCGGLVNLMFERLDADSDWSHAELESDSIKLYLFGAGHVGQALVRVLAGQYSLGRYSRRPSAVNAAGRGCRHLHRYPGSRNRCGAGRRLVSGHDARSRARSAP